ncbi:3-ketoacyl-acp reductase : 3-oxoacyl-[acyl-carrier-protein] reductase OS=Planctomyces maris DSM 8797 GN=PM8797T_01109 PE=3 SV=1: adh_short [Gemmataceae bacterium]|nr:3-ketoacyl-acp reductase : 3-oxoacyl-[acyl-carrier-protein] reductase OS=Planctomyces maris DSM 8797 GN=PM8797T_01109 PE=3 SV=1: adh_short [Gemmataceae bacterium]VTU00552.1 3-ketoacyl-acp reductase : 3-oxoacyl-[acyl-carrier-protein] reductase OS=Planctomyces maris DSM 8797 GN=PM8797T_01109 PE=3 SV=1: adh_short [Gemmataceae bacterium]
MSTPRKVALVTGSATGVGRACAVRFAKLGFAVAVNYSRSEADAMETVRLVEECGVPVLLCKANVGSDAEVRQMIGTTEAAFDRLDVLVNNAGTTHFVPHTDLDALTEDVWDDIFQVNVKGAFYCVRAALPLLKAAKGNVVNVTSVAGLTGQGSSIPYAASKAALNCVTQSLARAFGPDVRVNAVAPGPINTRWLAGKEAHIAKFVEQAPLGRAADPDDIADAVVYLATGTTLTTGQVLVVDGGRTM